MLGKGGGWGSRPIFEEFILLCKYNFSGGVLTPPPPISLDPHIHRDQTALTHDHEILLLLRYKNLEPTGVSKGCYNAFPKALV